MAEGGVRELGEDGDALDRLEVEAGDQHRQADQHQAEDGAERDLRVLGALGARDPEGGDGVGDGLDARQGAAQPEAKAFSRSRAPTVVALSGQHRGVPVRAWPC